MRAWFICLILLFSANLVGLGLIYTKLSALPKLLPIQELNLALKNQSEISTQLASLQNSWAKSNKVDLPNSVLGMSDLLPDKTTNQNITSNHFITTKPDTNPVYVYKEQAEFSQTMGSLIAGYRYPYFGKVGDWYLIGLSDGLTGWVKADTVIETP